jgi:hypothetical protein
MENLFSSLVFFHLYKMGFIQKHRKNIAKKRIIEKKTKDQFAYI